MSGIFNSITETANELGNIIEKEITSSVSKGILKIRTAVSKDKNRFIKDGFNLDLSYITNRIIAMGYPSTGELESNYRNRMADVQRFFETYHKDHYLIINLTEEPYDSTAFNNRVHHLGWPDHHSPALGLLIYCIQIIHNWLNAHPDNVVAIHCLAGRGRSGLLISSYLVSSDMYQGKLDDALKLFAMQRSSIGEGVTVPSQIRYVDYINRLSTREVDISMAQQPRTLVLNRLMMRPVPRHTSGWRPTIEILNVNIPLQPVVIYSNKDSLSTPLFYSDRDPVAIIDLPPNTTLSGDILIRVYSSNEQYVSEIINSFLDKPFFRFAFHTSFINGHFIDFKKHELDESNSVMKSNIYPNDFQIRLMFSEPSQSSPPQPQQYSPQQPRQQQPPQQQQPQQQSSPQQPRQQQQQQPPQYSPQQPRQQQQQPPQPYVQSEQDNIINFNNNNNNYDSNSNNNNNGNGNGYNSNQSSPSIISQISGSYQAPNPFEQDDDL